MRDTSIFFFLSVVGPLPVHGRFKKGLRTAQTIATFGSNAVCRISALEINSVVVNNHFVGKQLNFLTIYKIGVPGHFDKVFHKIGIKFYPNILNKSK
jgi:hypothetical protein